MVGILVDNEMIVGTGCHNENHITRVYVHPDFQKKGYGSFIMDCLEKEISKKSDKVYLDASLPASRLYEKRGYKTIEHCNYDVENGVVLVYEVMEKTVSNVTTEINYNGKIFVPKHNSKNGELDFCYQHINVKGEVKTGKCHGRK